jgi:hypothetical protein
LPTSVFCPRFYGEPLVLGFGEFFNLLEKKFCGQNLLQISSKLPIFVLPLLNLKMSYQRPLVPPAAYIFFGDWRLLDVTLVQQGVCHTVALPFTLKSILKQKKNYGNSYISPCKNIIFIKIL